MKKRKISALLLAIVMAFSMMPFSAMATSARELIMHYYPAPLITTPTPEAIMVPISIMPVASVTPMRPFPQAGQDTGMMVELFSPGAGGQAAANMAILHQFARLVAPDTPPTISWSHDPHPSTLFTTHGSNSLFVVDPDPGTRNDPNAFRMVMFLDAGTGGASQSHHSYRVTVCEAMGYGMLMLVQLAGSEDINLGPAFGNRTMRQLLLEGLPVGLRSQFSADPNAPNAVSFQTYFDAMFRTLRHFPSFPRSIAGGYGSYAAEHVDVTDNSYRASNTILPPGFRASYQMAWSIHHMPGQSRFQRETYPGRDGTPAAGPSTATDGTMDMAYALILASEQWGHAPVWCPVTPTGRVYSYLEWARRMVGDIWEGTVHHGRHRGTRPGAVVNPGYFLKIGNWTDSNGGWNDAGRLTRPSDHMIQHMRAFAAIDPGNDWQRVINVTHEAHRLVRQNTNVPGRPAGAMPNTGILPDFLRWNADYTGTSSNQWIIPRQGGQADPWSSRTDSERFHEFYVDGAMHQNACRVPWRLGVDVLFAGTRPYEDITTRALNDWLAPAPQGQGNAGGLWINQFGGNPNHGIQGRWLDGLATANTVWDYTGTHFRGPMLVVAAIYGPQNWFNTGWAAAINPIHIRPDASFNYYGDYINILSMIAASGNEWTPVGTSLTIHGGTTANGFSNVRRVVAGARVPLRAADPANFSRWEIQGAEFWPGYGPNTANTFIVMPANRDVVARTADAAGTYIVTVQGSHAAISGQGRHAAGDIVTIQAGTRRGYDFAGWTVTAGSVQLANPQSATTTFIMPTGAVTITANWERGELAVGAVGISARPVGTGFGVNDPVTVEIYIENPAVMSIGSISFLEVQFDSNVLEWNLPPNGLAAYNRANASTWPFAPGAISTAQRLTLNAPDRITQNSARFSFDSALDFSGSGVLVTLNLRVRPDAVLAPTSVNLTWTARPGAGMNCFYFADVVNADLRSGVVNLVDVLWAGVGTQSGTMVSGTADSVTFPVMTTLVSAGTHSITVNNLPPGVNAPTAIAIDSNGAGTLTLTGSAASVAGSFSLTLSIAGTTSQPFTLTVAGRSVAVGSQGAALTVGVAGTTTFPVTTENIPAGTHPISVQNLPAGVSVQGTTIAINANGTGTLTLVGTSAITTGVHNLTLNIGGTASAPFTLTIRRAGVLPQGPPVNIRAVGTSVAEWYSGSGILSWPQVNNALTLSSRGIGRHYIAFNRTDIWATSASYAIITITAEGITVRDGTAAWFEGPINLVPGGTNAKLLSYPDSPNLYIAWGAIPAGFIQLNNNEHRFD
jgi:uncharacterized repeat protein (TIGR02543 family)